MLRIKLSIAFFVVGAGLLALTAAGCGGGGGGKSTSAKGGGTLRLNVSSSDVQSIDPAVDYEFIGWAIEFATCLKLVNYPDLPGAAGTQLQPEAAEAMPTVSADGKTYTFKIRSGLKFNTGEEVTAATFAHVINRDLNPKLESPSAAFLHDLAGADAVLAGKATTAAGVKVNGNELKITLTKVAPDFIARLAMNFFCAVPLDLPVPLKGNTIPSAGPYYIASRTPNRSVIVKRNPNYKGSRPHHVDEMNFTVQVNINQSLLQVRNGEADYDVYGIPGTASAQLSKEFGINKGRFFVHPQNAVTYMAINTSRVKDVSIRQAINYAVDRPAIVRQAGVLAGTPTDQILPPTLRGFQDAKLYPLNGADVAKAKALMKGRSLALTLYTTNDPVGQAQAQVIVANLKAIGITVTSKPLPFSTLVTATGDPKEPYDLVLIAWLADYPDPVDFINILLLGSNIPPQNNVNLAVFDDPAFNGRMEAAERLPVPDRYAVFGKLDVDIMRDAAPWAALYNATVREFVSARVGCYIFQQAFAAMDLANACLK
jgi:peptide/nickel transport system substrate-binding protein